MHVIHGTWIPEDAHEFIQPGAFYLWVETDTPTGASRGSKSSKAKGKGPPNDPLASRERLSACSKVAKTSAIVVQFSPSAR
jgi:hypothetical protein